MAPAAAVAKWRRPLCLLARFYCIKASRRCVLYLPAPTPRQCSGRNSRCTSSFSLFVLGVLVGSQILAKIPLYTDAFDLTATTVKGLYLSLGGGALSIVFQTEAEVRACALALMLAKYHALAGQCLDYIAALYIILAVVAHLLSSPVIYHIYGSVCEDYQSFINHAWLRFTCIFDARITDYLQSHPYYA